MQDVDPSPTDRQYRAVILENEFLEATILTELGGRIYRLIYKPTGQSVFYENEPLKPNPFCLQGWWIATGGVEWCFPLTEHSTNCLRPWRWVARQNGDGSATVTVSDTHQRAGLAETISITLEPRSCALKLGFRLSNPGNTPRSFMFWTNALLPANDDVELVVPTRWMSHGSNEAHPWPVRDGKDRSFLRNWESFDGEFAVGLEAGFCGAYDHSRKLGLVRTFPQDAARGVKIFSYGHTKSAYLQPRRYTDTGRPYFELMGGYTPSFWSEETIRPRQVIEWSECWYPVADTGGFDAASADVAVERRVERLDSSRSRVLLTVFASRDIPGAAISVCAGGQVLAAWRRDLKCGEPLALDVTCLRQAEPGCVRIESRGRTLLICALQERRPISEQKQPSPPPGSAPTAPVTVADLVGADRLEEAISRFQAERPASASEATACGIALLRLGRTDEALAQLQSAARMRGAGGLADYLAGVILLNRGALKEAREALGRAVRADPRDTRSLNALALVQSWYSEDKEDGSALYSRVLALEPNDLFSTAELSAGGDGQARERLEKALKGSAQNHVELALECLNLAMCMRSQDWAAKATEIEPDNIAALACLFVSHLRSGRSKQADKVLEGIQAVDVERAVVYGSDAAVMALEEALRSKPEDSRLMLYLATAYQMRRSYEAARAMARRAAEAEPTLARAYLIQAQCLFRLREQQRDRSDSAAEAAQLVRKCLDLSPGRPEYYYFSAWILGARSRARLAAMRKALDLDPHCFQAYGPMGWQAMDERNYEEAVRWFRLASESPEHMSGEWALGHAYREWTRSLVRSGRYEDALARAAEADAVPTGWPHLDFVLAKAEALEGLRRGEEARALLQSALADRDRIINDGWAEDWYYLGCVLDKLGDREGARSLWLKCRQQLETVVKDYPRWDGGTCLLALTLNKLGQPEEALAAIKKLERKFDRLEEARLAYEEIRASLNATQGQQQ